MALEDLTGPNKFIANLVPANPPATDPASQGSDHIQGIKNVLQNSFPAMNGPYEIGVSQGSLANSMVRRDYVDVSFLRKTGGVMTGQLVSSMNSVASVADFRNQNDSGNYLSFTRASGGAAIGYIGSGTAVNGGTETDFGVSSAAGNLRLSAPTGIVQLNPNRVAGTRITALVQSAASTAGISIDDNSINPQAEAMRIQGGTNVAGAYFILCRNSSGAFYGLAQNGTATFTSDATLKKNIETARDGYLSDINALRVVKYNWKDHEDDAPKEIGLIAQEVEKVFPGLIQESPEGTKMLKGSVLIYFLLKAIQELSVKNDVLESRVLELEGK